MQFRWFFIFILVRLLLDSVHGGGSGLNILVVVNESHADSVRLGTDYCEQRQVPPENLLRVRWTGNQVSWTRADAETVLLNPIHAAIRDRGLEHQIDFVLLSIGFPYQVIGTGFNSTTSLLFYGFKEDPGYGPESPCTLPSSTVNRYAASEMRFRDHPPDGGGHKPLLAMMLTASNLPQAKAVLRQGVRSDGTHPLQPAQLAKTTDPARNVRHTLFDHAIFNARVLNRSKLERIFSNHPQSARQVMGYQTGLYLFSFSPDAFLPGAIADTLTSFAGKIFEPHDQTTVLSILQAGATASYGTITEPCNYLQKFPDPQVYFYQARGFSVAEAYYQSVKNPYQGLLVGEPLAAPFKITAGTSWMGPDENEVLNGMVPLRMRVATPHSMHPVGKVSLFANGRFVSVLTNLPPQQGNKLLVNLRNKEVVYTVGASESLATISKNLAELLNSPGERIQTRVTATAVGDRIELRSMDPELSGPEIPFSVGQHIGSATQLTTFLHSPGPLFLDSPAFGTRSFRITGTNAAGSTLSLTVTKTSGEKVQLQTSAEQGTTSLYQLVAEFIQKINEHPELQAPDGVLAEDLSPLLIQPDPNSSLSVDFTLKARSAGWKAAKIQAEIIGLPSMTCTPPGPATLEGNLEDLQPRQHLYVSAGSTNLLVDTSIDTRLFADGFHNWTVVAYEGTHPETQTHTVRNVQIQNRSWSALLEIPDAGPFTFTQTDFHPLVTTSGQVEVESIDLYSTGGLISRVTNSSSGNFTVSGPSLGAGLHPFHALVQSKSGERFRTRTVWIRLVDSTDPLELEITAPGEIRWTPLAGLEVQIWSRDSLNLPWNLRATVQPSKAEEALWRDPQTEGILQRFYRVSH